MSTDKVKQLLDKMWNDYTTLNPHALEIHNLFADREGAEIFNDHIALRTYNHPKVGVDALAKSFLAGGYVEKGTYVFEEKKLFAKHFEHPNENLPKVFISELKLEEFDQELNAIVNKILDELPQEIVDSSEFPVSGKNWKLNLDDYEKLLSKSEYAAWVAALGFRANHFTVFVNKLKTLENLTELNTLVKESGHTINNSGGEIKGSKEVYLEQSSTRAGKINFTFDSGETKEIPACYYEFALRYPMADGKLYQGFVAKSADKIFESTDVKI